MANEIRVQESIQIIFPNGYIYQPRPSVFFDDLVTTSARGPTPGAVVALTSYTDISLAELTAYGGWCRFTNKDSSNKVHLGVRHIVLGAFIPFCKLPPVANGQAKSVKFPLSEFLGTDLETGSGTGTGDSDTWVLSLKAENANCEVVVEAFDP